MDKKRRQKLKDVVRSLSEVIVAVEQVLEKELDCIENVPENLTGSERYECMENAVDYLEDAIEKLEEAKVDITNATAITPK